MSGRKGVAIKCAHSWAFVTAKRKSRYSHAVVLISRFAKPSNSHEHHNWIARRRRWWKSGTRLLLSNLRHCINIHSRQKRNKARNPSRHCYAASGAGTHFSPPGGTRAYLRARREFSWEPRLQRQKRAALSWTGWLARGTEERGWESGARLEVGV